MSHTERGGPRPPLLDPRTSLVMVCACAAGMAAAHDSAWATGVTVGIAVLVALQQVLGRWRS